MEPQEYWKLEFEYQTRDVLHRLEVQSQLGQSALKSMMLVNGAAIISMLTFIGNKGAVSHPPLLKTGAAAFVLGLLLSLVAYFGAYFSQAHFMNVAAYRAISAQSKMVGKADIETPKVHELCGSIYLYGAVILVFASVLSFAYGAWYVVNAIL